jgi:hypothetical protein
MPSSAPAKPDLSSFEARLASGQVSPPSWPDRLLLGGGLPLPVDLGPALEAISRKSNGSFDPFRSSARI